MRTKTKKRGKPNKGIRRFEDTYGLKAKGKLHKFFKADGLLREAHRYSELGFNDNEIAICINALCGVDVCRQQIKRWRKKDFIK